MSRVSRSTNKTILVQEICDAAKFYKELLVGRKFLLIFDNRCIEVVFKRDGFKHLTGVSSNLTALSFYQKAVKGILRSNQVWFDINDNLNMYINDHLRMYTSDYALI